MIIRFFNTNQPFILFFVVIISALLCLLPVFNPEHIPVANGQMPFYILLEHIIGKAPIVSIIGSMIIILINAVLTNSIATNYDLVPKGFAGSLIFVLICSSYSGFFNIPPTLPALTFLLLSLNAILSLTKENYRLDAVFNAGFYIALASLFYLPAIYFFIIVIVGINAFRARPLREICIAITGVVVPYSFVFVYYFWVDQLPWFIENSFAKIFSLFIPTQLPLPYQFLPIFILILVLMSFAKIGVKNAERTVKDKGIRAVFNLFFLVSILTYFTTANALPQHFVLAAAPITMSISPMLVNIRRPALSDVLFLLLVFLVFFSLSYSLEIFK
ncbi:MAG: hypothetical protein KKA07_05550 [Bacteroidetes bacterium]|nr:hypothetical protein [Bacteroidota bacterium]